MLARRIRGGRGGAARHDAGAVAVEFALVLPILVMLMFGIFTAGLAYSDHLAVTNAVREGARLGAAVPYNPSSSATWGNSVQTRVQQVYMNGTSTLSSSQVCVQLVTGGGAAVATPSAQGTCGTAPPTPSGVDPAACVVKVWVRKPASISLLVSPALNFDIGAKSVAYYGRTAGSCTAS